MKYTLDSPHNCFDAFLLPPPNERHTPLEKYKVGLLIPLPNANKKTTNMFLDYGMKTWKGEWPRFCTFSRMKGSPVFEWDGKTLTINNKKQLRKIQIGVITHGKVFGEISALNPTLVIEQTKVLK